MKEVWVGYNVGCTVGFHLGHSAWQIDQFPTCWPMNGLFVHWSRGWGVSSFSERLVCWCWSECDVTSGTLAMAAIVCWQSEADCAASKSDQMCEIRLTKLPYVAQQVGIEHFYAVTEIKGLSCRLRWMDEWRNLLTSTHVGNRLCHVGSQLVLTLTSDHLVNTGLAVGSLFKWLPIVPFHKDFSPSGEQLEHRKLAHEL